MKKNVSFKKLALTKKTISSLNTDNLKGGIYFDSIHICRHPQFRCTDRFSTCPEGH